MKIGILLPEGYNLAHLHKARSLAEAAVQLCRSGSKPVTVAIGLPHPDPGVWRQQEQFLKSAAPGITVRHLTWESVAAANAQRMFSRASFPHNFAGVERVMVARDWGSNFTDCDVWFNLAEPGMGPICTLRPTAHFCSGLMARQFPYAFANSIHADYWSKQTAAFRFWRHWSVVVATDPALPEALTSYAGIHPDKVILAPCLTDPPGRAESGNIARAKTRMLWRAEPGGGHDLAAASEGFLIYRDRGGQLSPVIACEMQPESFGEGSNVNAIVGLRATSRAFLDEVPVIQIASSAILARELEKSAFLWASNLKDGEGTALFEGPAFGLHVLAADTRANRLAAERAGGSVRFYLPGDPQSIADALAELDRGIGKAAAPAKGSVPVHTRAIHIGFVVDRLMEYSLA